MNIKSVKLIFFILFLCGLILFYLKGYNDDKKAHIAFVDKEIHGIIKSINYFEGGRGYPDMNINDKWEYLGIRGQKIQNYIKEGDSISKESGSEAITVYKKNNRNEWCKEVFK